MFGVSTPHGEGIAQIAFFGLFALQHRGQEAAGIAVSDGSRVRMHKDVGPGVERVHARRRWPRSAGTTASATPATAPPAPTRTRNIQPFLVETMHGPLAVAHNGNLVNAAALRDELLARGFGLTATSDTEVITLMLAAAGGDTWEDRVERTLPAWKGAYSLVMLAGDRVIAVRDPWGFRPLSRRPPAPRRLRGGLGDVRAEHARLPRRQRGAARRDRHAAAAPRCTRRQALTAGGDPAACTFEFVYFAAPTVCGQVATCTTCASDWASSWRSSRRWMPTSSSRCPTASIPAAIGYSRSQRHPAQRRADQEPLHRPHVHRADARPARRGVALKFNALAENLAGKRVVMIDDSLVRGTTAGPLVRLVREAGRHRGAPAHHLPADHPPLPLRCRHGPRRRPDGRPSATSRRSAT